MTECVTGHFIRSIYKEHTNSKKVNNLLLNLRNIDYTYNKDLIQQIVPLKNEITPGLLCRLEEIVENPRITIDSYSHECIYIIFLLALFRSEEAFYPLIQILEMKNYERLIGINTITEGMHKIIASCYNGDIETLSAVTTNDDLEEFCQFAALETMTILYTKNLLSREYTISQLIEIITESKNELLISSAIDTASMIYPDKLMGHIKTAFQSGLADTFITGELHEIENLYKHSTAEIALNKLKNNPRYDYINDIHTEILLSIRIL